MVQSFLAPNTGAVVPVEELRWGVPPSPEIGDYSSDLPAILARRLGRGAAEVAAEFASRIQFPDGLVDRVDATRSGFLNIRLSEAALRGRVSEIVDTGVGYGADPTVHNGSRILLEFVSAQPTGPLTTAHGRSAAFGDSLAAILEACGAAVTRESYVNDAGIHLDRLVRSVSALGRTHLAPRKPELFARPAAALLTAVRDEVLSGHGSLLSKLGLSVDNWVLETDVSAPGGHLETSLRRLKVARRSYEEAGATWLRTTEFGDQQDRVLVRGNGRPTYLACDLAYHAGKFARGYDHLIDVWGVDHSLYVERTLAGIRALDLPEERLSILILQPVQFQRDGVTLDGPELGNTGELSDVVNLIGPEMTRFMLVSAPASVSLGIDLSD
ncbi:MAG: arginyl-tRNA synthetase, partial [bacterium]